MQVSFIRHGQSTGNAGLPCFDLAKLELTDAGRAQAARVAAAWDGPPTLIAVSPYLRTQQTAQPTIDRFPGVPVRVLPMQEFTYLEPSRWNGSSRTQRLPHIEAYWSQADPAYRDGPGSESFETLLSRVGCTLGALSALPEGARVYAFSHGQFMQALRVVLLNPGWPAARQMAHFWPFNTRFPILNGDRLDVTRRDRRWHTRAMAG